jgi:hypothetical protein
LKSLVTLHLAVLHDAGLHCAIHVHRDADTIRSRWEHEGDSFLTITLPEFAKALEKGLRDGSWPRHMVPAFRHHGGLPHFLGGFLSRVFSDDGNILPNPDPDAIWAVRQICYLTGKLERDCTPERIQRAKAQFVKTDEELMEHYMVGIDPALWRHFNQWTLHLFGDLFDKLETVVSSFSLIPRHGPGAVADRLDHRQRWELDYWTERLNEVFPSELYSSNLPTGPRDLVAPQHELPVRVVCVPKTQKTPRIIAIEPSTVQFAQQGLKREIYAGVEHSDLSGVLGFTDQERNQKLAHQGSLIGSLATLDLSEASDRVHTEIVEELFRYHPHLRDFVMATRSAKADLDGEVFNLAKFASMGSALTFPIEAMIFTVIACMGVYAQKFPRIRDIHGSVSVYGDDIVVPVDRVGDVVDGLEAFGFKVNMHKSFWTGMFRESCGKEYFNGYDVSVVRLRAEVPTSRHDAALINRFVDFRNRAYNAGLWRTVKVADDVVTDVFPALPPRRRDRDISDSFPALALDTVLRTKWRGRWNDDLHIWQERYPKVRALSTSYVVDGEPGLLKWFLENHDRTVQYQTDRYEGQERAHTFRIKWAGIEAPAKELQLD